MSLENLHCIQSVDSLKLAKKISNKSMSLNRELEIMIQMKPEFYYSTEDINQILESGNSNATNRINYSWTKSGIDVQELPELLNFILKEQTALKLKGLMIIGEPDDFGIFKVMKNIKNVLQKKYSLKLGILKKIYQWE
jgi:uncharacterized pyridoxal phosphate-containing UPF0001 family protein